MTSIQRRTVPFALSILFAVAPFVAGIVRANSKAHDLRLMWMALIASTGAIVIVTVVKLPEGRSPQWFAFSVGVFAVGLSTLTAFLLGAQAIAGVLAIGIVFGFCFAMYCWLDLFSRRST